ncbi:MAG: hypothetical protein SOI10_03785, partial [Lactobacillus delbrueckii]
MSSITYSERIKIETFCELGLSNIQMGVLINFTIYQLNKSTIEFYLPYEDVQNALKESAQNPFMRTKDEWV